MQANAAYKATIDAHVAAYGVPNVVSLAEDVHIFHFELATDNMWDGDLLLINKNGHHFRIIREHGAWHYIKHWEGKPDFMHFERWARPGLKNADPVALIALAGTGPQSSNGLGETLCLLPKGTTQRRKVVWRGTILDIRFDKHSDSFTISTDPTNSATFIGRPWVSKKAARWCAANIGKPVVSLAQRAEVKKQDAQIMSDLEDSSIWGIF